VWANDANATKIITALNAFGFANVGISVSDFLREDSVVQLGYPPYRIDILTSIDGLEFAEAWASRVMVRINNMDVPFISRDDLITNKTAVGRPQDIADVQRLTE
jgi:hypothetical protein